ncbi:MAG: tRNA (N6-isopentenyl adenosine(37)-C2)-methylthiotransferase MiaB [Bryobacterales bacterium]|nr:tRNA (N6-isopentenyl adenosine(37)-C2)-methylthiotransferase MiaB [Bryobacterales bacterium]
MNKFYIETFGCQMNVHDSEKIIGTMLSKGYTQVATPDDADFVLYNTCSIRDKAEQKVYHRLDTFKNGSGKNKRFAVLGCVAQQEGEAIFEKAPHVNLVAGSASYNKLPEYLVQIENGAQRVTGLSLDTNDTFETPLTRRDNPHKAYITIIEGCNKNCTYCVVPFTRGRERSRAAESVMEEARQLINLGYTEIMLLGQNVNSYEDPSGKGWRFAELLARLAELPGLRRLRFTTSHPRDFHREIVDAITANPVICNYVHLPVQSGSTRILERMDRQYTREQYMERISWLKASPRKIALSSDIIVGFPGETDEDFEQTMSLLDEVQYSSLFSFKYSQRPNTRALEYTDHVPEEVKRQRLLRLQEHQRQIQIGLNESYVGRVEEVFVEGFNTHTGQWIGKTSQFRTLNFTVPASDVPASGSLAGQYRMVRITRSSPNALAGEQVSLS